MWNSKTDRFSSGRALYPRASASALPWGRSGLRTWTGFYGAGDKVDLTHLPPLTDAQKAQLQALAAMQDSDIDYSDSAALDDTFWQNAVQNPFYRPTKQSTTVRVDADVLAWLKGQGKGYQTRLNAILREAMLRSLQHKA